MLVRRHLQQFWGLSGNLWQSLWDRVYDYFEGDQFKIVMYGKLTVNGNPTLHLFTLKLLQEEFQLNQRKFRLTLARARPIS